MQSEPENKVDALPERAGTGFARAAQQTTSLFEA